MSLGLLFICKLCFLQFISYRTYNFFKNFSNNIIFIFLIALAIRAHIKKASTGREGLIGEIGMARTDIDPEGKVFVHGEIWYAESEEKVPKGSKVKVVKVMKNLKIKVTKA